MVKNLTFIVVCVNIVTYIKKSEVNMELESITSYIVLTSILGFFTIGLLSNFFFPLFMEENDKLNNDSLD